MPKKPSQGGESSAPKTTVKLSSELHRRLRTVASYLGMELADYLDSILRPVADKAYSEMAEEIRKQDVRKKE